jgi:DNA-binding transcriptional ArsR family regulator
MDETLPTATLMDLPTLERVAGHLRLYAHPLRVRIIDFLATSKRPRRVTEIIGVSEGIPQAIVSQQLRLLRDSGILKAERQGNAMYYSIAHPRDMELLKGVRRLAQDLEGSEAVDSES